MATGNAASYPIKRSAHRSWAMVRLQAALDRLSRYPLICAVLSVLGFAFLGPIAAIVIVGTILDHEYAHRFMMVRLGYRPGPVRLLPMLGAYVRAGRPMLRSADIALIYLAGPLTGILSAEAAAYVASKTLTGGFEQQIFVGASVAIGLNLFNLLPYEPLDGGLICRALPYPTLLLFPLGLAAWMFSDGLLGTPGGMVAIAVATAIALQRVNKWRHYAAGLRARMEQGETTALQAWQASFNVPMFIRLLVACVYLLTVIGGAEMFVNLTTLARL